MFLNAKEAYCLTINYLQVYVQEKIFSLCPVSHFAQEQFWNRLAQNKNSNFASQSDNSFFAQDCHLNQNTTKVTLTR